MLKVFEDIHCLNEITRSSGFLAMNSYSDKIKDAFLKDAVFLITNLVRNENSEIYMVTNLLAPRLYSNNVCGLEFVKALLIYEAMLMIVTGSPTWMIDYKLYGALGIDVSAEKLSQHQNQC